MKIGVSTNLSDKKGYARWGEDMYKKLKEHGFSCTDYNMADTSDPVYTLPLKESDNMLLRERRLAEAAEIEIFQVHGPWRYPPKDFTEEDRAERMEKMQKSIRAVAVLGCKNWVIHPIMPFGLEDVNTENEAKTWDMNIEFMGKLIKTAEEFDVTICLENMPMHRFSLAKPEAVLKMVKTFNNKHFKACLDTGHVTVFDELNIGDEVRRLGDELKVLHVHDNTFRIDLHMLPYFGKTDWSSFASALGDIGFNGCLSLETLPPKALPDDIFEDACKLLVRITKNIVKDI